MRVLFIGGIGRSGSTLIERLLGELPGICTLGEVGQLWKRAARPDIRCGCGTAFANCPFWTFVGEEAFGGWNELDASQISRLQRATARFRHIPRLAGSRLRPDQRAAVQDYASLYTKVYRAAMKASGAEVILDATKVPALGLCLRWVPEVDLRVVHLVRDPRGVAYSWTKRVARPETDGLQQMPRYSPISTAMQWNLQNATLDLLARSGQNQSASEPRVATYRVRYEDFIADPRTTIRAIAEFASTPVNEDELAFLGDDHAALRAAHGVAGNPMRFAAGRVVLRRDDDWLSEFPRTPRCLVGALCAPLMRRYGYPVIGGIRRQPAEKTD